MEGEHRWKPWKKPHDERCTEDDRSKKIERSQVKGFHENIKVSPNQVQISEKGHGEFPALRTEINDGAPNTDLIVVGVSDQAVLLARTQHKTCSGCISEEAIDIMSMMVDSGFFNPDDRRVSLSVFLPSTVMPSTVKRDLRDNPVDLLVKEYMDALSKAYSRDRNHMWVLLLKLYFPLQREGIASTTRAEFYIDKDENVIVRDAANQLKITRHDQLRFSYFNKSPLLNVPV